jgi:enamine deaminase RidA (YjgF/YER057c/UK114 family)
MLEFSNPANVHTPLGLYSHTVTVPTATELIYLSGQLGVRPDGSTPASIEEQADQVFANIVASTAVYVSQLVDPKWLVEVEAIAARRAGLSSAKRASESAHPPG